MISPGLRKVLQEALKIATAAKTPAYIVGGFPRDLLLGRISGDIDLAVPKNPKSIAKKVAQKFKASLAVLSDEEEIYRVILKDGVYIDIGKYKAATIEKDLMLRDFTINALAVELGEALKLKGPAELKKKLIDPSDGITDLARKKIRQVSAKSFTDDPLRMLRAFRCAAQLNFSIDPATQKSIKKLSKRITEPAMERVREEILLTLDVPQSYETVRAMDQAGLLSAIFPEIDPNRKCAISYYPGKGVWGHSLDGLKNLEWIFDHLKPEFGANHEKIRETIFAKDKDTEGHPRAALMKLGILFHDIGKAPTAKMIDGRLRFYQHEFVGARMTRRIAERLRMSVNANRHVSGFVLAHMRPGSLAHAPELTERAKYRFFRDLGVSAIPMLLIALADRYTYLTEKERGSGADLHERVTKDIIRWHFQKLKDQPAVRPKLINGHILMKALNLKPGPQIGALLKELDEAIATGEIKTKAEAIAAAKAYIAR